MSKSPCEYCDRTDIKCCVTCGKDASNCDVMHNCGEDCSEYALRIITSRLSIEEVIGHCERRTKTYDEFYGVGYFDDAPIADNCTKEYWEHRQVAEWLTELKEYRSLGTPEQLREIDKLYLEKCEEVNALRAQLAAAKGEAE